MATFKIRDLMVALRPGVPTPERPKPLVDCQVSCGGNGGDGVDSNGGGGDCGDSDCACSACSDTGCDPCTDNCPTCSACTETCGACTDQCGTCSALSPLGPCGLCTVCTDGTDCGWDSMGCNHSRPVLLAARMQPGAPAIARMAAKELAVLKNQLRRTMQQVSRRENVLAAAAEQGAIVPQTIAQVDALEQKLSEALEELRARRAELQKAAPAEGKKGRHGEKGKKSGSDQ
jgi:hypothetical protein